jgi:hypothetical protein
LWLDQTFIRPYSTKTFSWRLLAEAGQVLSATSAYLPQYPIAARCQTALADLETEDFANRRWPSSGIGTVNTKQGYRKSIHPKGNAAGVGRLARPGADTPDLTEMVSMIIETHAGSRHGRGVVWNEQLKFQ